MYPKPSLRAHIANQDGIALVSSLLITLLMTLVVIALAYRVHLFSVGTRDNVVKSQNLYTADVGLNQARYFFLDKDCAMSTLNEWKCSNGSLTIGSTYKEITSELLGTFTANLTIPLSDKNIVFDRTNASVTGTSNEEYSYKIYAKASGMQDVISVMTVATRAGNPASTVIDAGLKYNVKLGDDSTRNKNQGPEGSGVSKEALGDTATSTVNSVIP